jgi:hypothetical protein
MQAAKSYLRLCSDYCQHLGGLRWSATEDALEYPDGATFAFNEEVALFLEGFASAGRLIAFGHVLHLLHLLRRGGRRTTPEAARLARAYADAGRPLRNAGAFCAALVRDVPEAAGPVPVQEVLDRLRNQGMPIRWYLVSFHDAFFPAEVPPLPPAAFEDHFYQRLRNYGDEELRHWLRHGRGPVCDAAAALAREMPPPRSLSGALAALLERPRLAGARPFVAQLVSALTLPPRRLAPPEMPIGGYADVTTHGRPDQILPGQLALDEWDFLRRYADRELLYFRREEPHARTEHELVVLLDQGVRTWGDVRLVLGAAVLALGRQADRKRLPFLLAATSGGGELLDPVAADDEVIGALVEASDLTANPGLALERVLEAPGRPGRDVVLLTHPRALAEEDVRAAARRAGAGTRLFALALDEHGRAELSEMKHGAPVSVRQFRIDLSAPAAVPAAPAKAPAGGPWRGDVEPVGYPFQFGPGSPLVGKLLDFDQAGRWLLTVSARGMLHAWRTDGEGVEVLPRGMLDGLVLGEPEAVVGVAGGFVVCGGVASGQAAFHYDFRRRTCTGRFLGSWLTANSGWEWGYSHEHHCLIVHRGGKGCALDLATGLLHASGEEGPDSRARHAWLTWMHPRGPRRRLRTLGNRPPPTSTPDGPSCYLDPASGTVYLGGLTAPLRSFTPLADGKPALQNSLALAAEYRAWTLALKTVTLGARGGWWVRLFGAPDGTPAAAYPMGSADLGFALSADGRLLARQVNEWRAEVREVAGGRPAVVTRRGGFSPHLGLRLGDGWLLLHTPRRYMHLLRWDGGPLKVIHQRGEWGRVADPTAFADRGPPVRGGGAAGTADDVPLALRYDPRRFLRGAWHGLVAVSDCFGQVAVLDHELELVCMFLVVRDRLAGWMPDGTCFGPSLVTGRPEAADAPARFGEALRRAARGGRQPS